MSPIVLREILDGGQSFRWYCDTEGVWTGTWAGSLAQLRLADGRLDWRAPASIEPRVARSLPSYLAADIDWAATVDSLPWRSDPGLRLAVDAFPGLRILRQPFGETLLGFLCSATKQIVQIKQMLALLAERHGTPLCRAGAPNPASSSTSTSSRAGSPNPASPILHRRLPTWPELATIPEKDLRACLLGFRAKFIRETALFLAENPGWLDETERLPYPAAKARLVGLPGVGEKVADCVLLFGAGRLEAFPVDVWILKALERRYGLARWKPSQLAQFGRAHFGPQAGLAQQYLFAHERAARKDRPAGRPPPPAAT